MTNGKEKIDITIEALQKDGWEKSESQDPACFMRKKIENTNPLNASEDSDIELIIHGMYNTNTFAVLLPGGGMLNFVANSMLELQAFERAIMFYDPPF